MSSLPYLAHGATLALAWFLAIDAAACAAVACAPRRWIGRWIDRWIDRRGASPSFWLAARLFPAVAATAFVLALFIPSYWKYEPRELVEGFDVTLTLFAAAALLLISAGAARGVSAWRSAARRARDWMRHAQPIALGGPTLPALAIDARQPMMALVGVLRPRLLVTRGLVDALTESELAASVAHEQGHLRALDNLKRLLMRSAPDLLAWLGTAREIERRWALAAERAADRRAAGGDAASRCTLASALVKVARLTPPTLPETEPISTLLTGDVALRVHDLLAEKPDPMPTRVIALRWTLALCAAVPLAIAYAPLLRAVHDATELLVHSLP